MRLKGSIIILLSVFYTYCSFAQSKGPELTQSRILILLDESSSMIQSWAGGKEKYKAADELILRIMDSVYKVNNQVEFSLRVFGHQYPVQDNNCYDTKNEVPFGRGNRDQMALRLEDIRPLGVTPIAYALSEAARYDLVDEAHNAYSIILITDGGESCGGDICDVMKSLIASKVYFKPYIVSLEDFPELKVTYSCMGDYLQVTHQADIPKAVSTIVEAFRPILKLTPTEYKQIQNIAATVPSVLKTNIPEISVPEAPKPEPKKSKDTVIVHEPPKAHDVKVNESWQKPPVEALNAVPIAHLKTINNKTSFQKLQPIDPAQIPALPEIVNEAPPLPVAESITPATAAKLKKLPTPPIAGVPMKTMVVPDVPPIVVEAQPLPQVQGIATSVPARLRLMDVPMSPEKKLVVLKDIPALPEIVVEKPAALSQSEIIASVTPARLRLIDVPPAPVKKLKNIKDIPALPEIVVEKPAALPQTDIIATVTPSKLRLIDVPPAPVKKLKGIKDIPALPEIVVENPIVLPSVEKLTRVPLLPLKTMNIIIVFDEHSYSPRSVPPMPPIKTEPVPPPAATPVATKKPPVNGKTTPPATTPEKKVDYKVETEDAKETTLEVYFTDGKGKYYPVEPQILMMDRTNNVIKKFFRTVDASGNPDPQTNMPVGTYNFALAEQRDLIIKNVAIEPNKKNKLIFTVKPSTLDFSYVGAPKRPVAEFSAIVIERNKDQGRIQNQKCSDHVEYEPGNYHVEINTFPKTVRNVEIVLNGTIVAIPQPGFAKFTSDGKTRVVTLYQQLGDKFLAFYTLDLNDPASKHLQIQPGAYQAHFQKGPVNTSAAEKVIPFLIKATEETEVILQ